MGALWYLRIGELRREWDKECYAAQLDVRKAIDHVCHDAPLRDGRHGRENTLESIDGIGLVTKQDAHDSDRHHEKV